MDVQNSIQVLSGIIPNPGDGDFRIGKGIGADSFSSITIEQSDPTISLTGTLLFSIGIASDQIDLAAGERTMGLAYPVPFVDVTLTGVAPKNTQFKIILA